MYCKPMLYLIYKLKVSKLHYKTKSQYYLEFDPIGNGSHCIFNSICVREQFCPLPPACRCAKREMRHTFSDGDEGEEGDAEVIIERNNQVRINCNSRVRFHFKSSCKCCTYMVMVVIMMWRRMLKIKVEQSKWIGQSHLKWDVKLKCPTCYVHGDGGGEVVVADAEIMIIERSNRRVTLEHIEIRFNLGCNDCIALT